MRLLEVALKRPAYARGENFDVDPGDLDSKYWRPLGITKDFLGSLSDCAWSNTADLTVAEGYLPEEDRYILYLSVETLRRKFSERWEELFRQFDNLKTLGMLEAVAVPLRLISGVEANVHHFSDGQFQSVYIYSILELFKDRNCLVLLDEPDAFLHPEWQFNFLEQISNIANFAVKASHVLLSSHSASTISNSRASVINLFEFDGEKVALIQATKADVIKSLSAGLITFSQHEATLNIQQFLKNTHGPVLFTEGITDEMILETAWTKLYPTERMCCEIQNAFSCGFQRNLVNDKVLYQNHPGRTFFALFDFDEAYNDWNQLGKDIQTDPYRCLVKKRQNCESYAVLLPVPGNEKIRAQVINPRTGGHFGSKSLLTIEHLFYGVEGLDKYFIVDIERTDGFVKFVSDSQKVNFARDIVPSLSPASFAAFLPLFEFIKSKCQVIAIDNDRNSTDS